MDRTHVPLHIPHKIEAGVAATIVALRFRHPSWGPRKLRAALMRSAPGQDWPAASTIGDLLRREGLVDRRRRRRPALRQTQPFADIRQANDTWCLDFKGWFRTGDGQRCDPLTVSDAYSRYLLECRIVPPTGAGVQPVIEGLLREHGLPGAIRSDNGPPFASTAAGGLSQLSVSWLKLGIRLERIEPGHPEQNGRHERLHRTLKAETLQSRPPIRAPSRPASTPSERSTTRNVPTKRWARLRRPLSGNQARAPIPRASMIRPTALTTRSDGSAPMARSNGVAASCSSARP